MFEEFTDNNEILKITASDPLDKSVGIFVSFCAPWKFATRGVFKRSFIAARKFFTRI